MSFSNIVDSVITPGSVTVSRQGFGIPLLVYKHTKRPGLVLSVSDAASLVSDFGFSRVTDAALFHVVDQIFAQTPKPAVLKIGRRQTSLTPIYKLTVPATGLVPFQTVSVEVNGSLATFTGDATPTDAELATGLAAAINAIVPGHAAAALGVVTCTSPADLPVVLSNWSKELSFNDATVTGAVATDLDAIFAEDSDFFGFGFVHAPDAEGVAVSTWASGHERMFLPTWNETLIVDGASTTDIGYLLKAANYSYTTSFYTRRYTNDGLALALFATLGANFNPGQETFAHKGLAAVAADKLTTTEIAALEAKNVNFYAKYLGLETTYPGVVAGGPLVYTDIVRGLAWLNSEIKATAYETIRGTPGKIAYTDRGAAKIGNAIDGVLNRATTDDFPVLREDPRPALAFPKVSAVASSDKAIRQYGPYTWTAELAGAIHGVKIRGTVTL